MDIRMEMNPYPHGPVDSPMECDDVEHPGCVHFQFSHLNGLNEIQRENNKTTNSPVYSAVTGAGRTIRTTAVLDVQYDFSGGQRRRMTTMDELAGRIDRKTRRRLQRSGNVRMLQYTARFTVEPDNAYASL